MTVARQAWSGDAQNAGSPPKAEEQPMTKMVQAPLCGKIGRPLKQVLATRAREQRVKISATVRWPRETRKKAQRLQHSQEGSAARKTPFCKIGAHRAPPISLCSMAQRTLGHIIAFSTRA